MTAKLSRRLTSLSAWTAVLLWAGVACAQTGGEAKVVSMTGQVTILRDGATWAINAGEILNPDQMIVTGPDGYAQLKLADGSTFEVFQNARVSFRTNRGDWRDLLEVWLGKVKVQIEHLGGANPNSVRTPTAVIAVRGTVFDVDVQDEDATTMVLCVEGRVEVSHRLQPGKSQALNPGEAVTVFKNQPLQARGVVDRGVLAQKIMRAFSDAANQILLRASHPTAGAGATSGTAGAGGTAASGDKSGAPTPTGAPPPAPPPPPPPG